jgi:hypothetical protein
MHQNKHLFGLLQVTDAMMMMRVTIFSLLYFFLIWVSVGFLITGNV